MSAGHSGGPKIKPVYIIILIALVFGLSIYDHIHHMGDKFDLGGVVYATILYFFMHHVSPVPESPLLMIAQYLALILVLAGIFSFVYKNIYKAFLLARVKRSYKGHIVVFGLDKLGKNICAELAKSGYKVIAVEAHEDNHHVEALRKKGVLVFTEKVSKKLLDNVNLPYAATCILAGESDETNIALAGTITGYRKEQPGDKTLKILVHVQNNDNIDILKDYFDINNEDQHYDLETFNISQMAAAHIYDQYPVHEYLNDGDTKDNEQGIVVVGYNAAAEKFLVENLILSHSPEMENLKIYLVDEHAETRFHEFDYKYPYFRDFAEIIPVKLRNDSFFANFSWSKEHIEKLTKARAVYIFGDNDSALINTATSFRQFLYSQTRAITNVPVVVCLPEDTGILDLLNATKKADANISKTFSASLNINYFRMISDTCTAGALIEQKAVIDRQARLINYFYSVKYGFEGILKDRLKVANASQATAHLADLFLAIPEQHTQVNEEMIEQTLFAHLNKDTGLSMEVLKANFSIEKVWNELSSRKKDSNRYAARHVKSKIYSLKRIGCWPLNKENITRYYPRLAPLEHKRWSAEKMVFNFKYGPFPDSKEEKYLLKEVLKIHDQLIPYERLTEGEKQKDLNIFLMLPLLNALYK